MKIFSFPHVVIYELMKEFGFIERISLSYCSRKANAFVKTFANTNQDLNITLCAYDEDRYSIFHPRKFFISVLSKQASFLQTFNLKTGHVSKYGFNEQGHFIIYCDDVVRECREIADYICDLFKIPVANLTIASESVLWLLDFAQRRQEQPLKTVYMPHCDVTAESYLRLISCNATKNLQCWISPPNNFRFDAKLPTVKDLIIAYGSWISREQLLGLESHIAQICSAQLTSLDINALLRSWVNGGLPNLQFLRIFGKTLNNQVYEGIRDRLEQVEREISYNWEHLGPAAKFDTNAFHIRNDDGVVATVTFIDKLFVMAVWPDLDGNRV